VPSADLVEQAMPYAPLDGDIRRVSMYTRSRQGILLNGAVTMCIVGVRRKQKWRCKTIELTCPVVRGEGSLTVATGLIKELNWRTKDSGDRQDISRLEWDHDVCANIWSCGSDIKAASIDSSPPPDHSYVVGPIIYIAESAPDASQRSVEKTRLNQKHSFSLATKKKESERK